MFDKSGNVTRMVYMADGRRVRTLHKNKTYSPGLSYLLDNVPVYRDPNYVYEEIRDGDLLFKGKVLDRVDVPGGYFKISDPDISRMIGY